MDRCHTRVAAVASGEHASICGVLMLRLGRSRDLREWARVCFGEGWFSMPVVEKMARLANGETPGGDTIGIE